MGEHSLYVILLFIINIAVSISKFLFRSLPQAYNGSSLAPPTNQLADRVYIYRYVSSYFQRILQTQSFFDRAKTFFLQKYSPKTINLTEATFRFNRYMSDVGPF